MELATSRFIGTTNGACDIPYFRDFFLTSHSSFLLLTTHSSLLTSHSIQIISTKCSISIGKLLGISWALVDRPEGWGPTKAQPTPNQGATRTQTLKKDIRSITERIWLISSSRKPDVSSFRWLIRIQRIVSFSL